MRMTQIDFAFFSDEYDISRTQSEKTKCVPTGDKHRDTEYISEADTPMCFHDRLDSILQIKSRKSKNSLDAQLEEIAEFVDK